MSESHSPDIRDNSDVPTLVQEYRSILVSGRVSEAASFLKANETNKEFVMWAELLSELYRNVRKQRKWRSFIAVLSLACVVAVVFFFVVFQLQISNQGTKLDSVEMEIQNQSSNLTSFENDVRQKFSIYSMVKEIRFDKVRGLLFNSWENSSAKGHSKFIHVYNPDDRMLQWTITDDGKSGSFEYSSNSEITPAGLESSGGYITFYTSPCDKLKFKAVRFRCRASSTQGSPDVGMRLVVDNPHLQGDRELAVYELDSLNSVTPIEPGWKVYSLKLDLFELKALRPPLPEGIDMNTINKIVFYVDVKKAKKCKAATFEFSDITFEPIATK
jgi:hypothetical protein